MQNYSTIEVELMKLTGAKGFLFIDDTAAHNSLSIAFVKVMSDIVVNKIYQTGLNITTTHEEKTDITGKTIFAGEILTPGKGDSYAYIFDSIQLASGTILAYYR